MVDQGLELGIWLGMAGVALVWAHLVLWRTHRVLNRARITSGLAEVTSLPCPALTPGPVLVPGGVLASAAVLMPAAVVEIAT